MHRKIFVSSQKGSVSSLDEKTLIDRIVEKFGRASAKYPKGAGDDCSVLGKSSFLRNIYATVDSVIFGVHFDEKSDPALVGKKLVSRNASDIASMGGAPKYALVSAQFSNDLSLKWLDEFCKGAAFESEKIGMKIVGGDVAKFPQKGIFCAQMALLGDSNLRGLLRRGAKVGDAVFSTGTLGLSFESGKHLSFDARINEGKFLAAREEVSSCTDLSDGLASDLLNLIPQGACAELAGVPGTRFGKRTASLEEALCGGEDYELLFTVRETKKAAFLKAYKKRFGTEPFEIGKIAIPKRDGERGRIVVAFPESGRKIFRKKGYSH